MGLDYKKFKKGMQIIPNSTDENNTVGQFSAAADDDGNAYYHNDNSSSQIVTADHPATLTNKTINGNDNTITNVPSGALPANVVYTDNTQTLTNKTIATSANTITGDANRVAQFSASGALSASSVNMSDVVTLSGSQTLINKTINGSNNTISNIPNSALSASVVISDSVQTLTNKTISNQNNTINGFTANRVLISDATGRASVSSIAASDILSAPGGTLAIVSGGTGATTKAAAFDALSPMSAGGDIIVGGASGTGQRLPNGLNGQYLKANGGTTPPSWQTFNDPTIQRFTATGTITGYLFTISTSSTVAAGDTYSHNSQTFTVIYALAAESGQVLYTTSTGAPLASGTLTRVTGSGTASITFTSQVALATYTPASNAVRLRVRMLGGGGGGAASGAAGGAGGAGTTTAFGTRRAGGGAGGVLLNGGAGGVVAGGGYTLVAGIDGGSGGPGGANPTTANGTQMAGGSGAATYFGGSGRGGGSGGVGVAGSTNSGAGGGGGGCDNTGAQQSGGGGGAGSYLEFIISSPSGTFPYCVGTGGVGGTNVRAGGAGAAGIIIIEELYQ